MSKFLKAKRSRFVVKKERYETVEPAVGKAECASGVELKAGGTNGVAAESCFGFQTSPVDFEQI